ncbi:13392_t:CDS:2, partial [Funneliformis geosporum]
NENNGSNKSSEGDDGNKVNKVNGYINIGEGNGGEKNKSNGNDEEIKVLAVIKKTKVTVMMKETKVIVIMSNCNNVNGDDEGDKGSESNCNKRK